jgi:hypothetical protein
VTTYYQVIPNSKMAPSFMPTFDGNQYTITVMWNVSAKRYYIMCQDTNGNLIFFVPIVTTLIAFPLINVEYDEPNSRVVATVGNNIPFKIGSVFNANIINNQPVGYNGYGLASVLSETEFIYNLSPSPGLCTALGAVEFLVSLTQGYFQSTLIYRNGQFEVNP